jgi:hypothetical protein
MPLSAQAAKRHDEEGNPGVKCNAQYKKDKSWNCLLKPNEAIQLARNLLQKAQLLLEEGVDDYAVHVWSAGPGNETLSCGLNVARKGPRRKKKKATR